MAYQALYRKWRPDEFEEVKGQEHIVKTLKNQIVADRVGHAYLFCGTRGTGKTTVAKLFAKAVNCEHPIDGSPCNQCAACKAIQAQSSMNVIEIDAASNNGVENIREIRDNVQYSPTEGKYKVYIIDEVHMLSIGAFNALLKTLEEPPSYVIFILATTEAHKIPVTILSRCQRYDFKRISIDTIASRLEELMQREQIPVEAKALRYVAKAADGSMRDALSLLDQCIAFHLGETLTYEHVLDVLGAVDMEVLSKLYHRIAEQDVSGMLSHIEELVMDGREMGQLVNDFTWYLRNLLLVRESPDLQDVLEVSKEQLEELKREAESCDSETLMRYIRICSDLSNKLRYSSQKRIDVELAFVKLCKPQMESDFTSLKERLRQLEEKVEELKTQGIQVETVSAATVESREQENSEPTYDLKEELKKRLEPAELQDLKDLLGRLPEVEQWLQRNGSMVVQGAFQKCKIALGENGKLLKLVFPRDSIWKESMERSSAKEDLAMAFSQVCGKQVEFDIVMVPKGKEKNIEYADIRKLVTMDIEEQ